MVSGTVDHCKEHLSEGHISDLCHSLQQGTVGILALRECKLTDKDYKKLLKVLGGCTSILHLSLSVGIVSDSFRVQVLAQMIQKNRSLVSLFLHGNNIRDDGVKVLYPALCHHPHILSLDLGDCQIGDPGLELLCRLLINKTTRPGLFDLTLSGNPAITGRGWTQLGLALAAGNHLRSLYLDYNEIGDNAAASLLVAMTASKSLETLDLEATGVTETTAQTLLHLIQNYPVALKKVNLSENAVSPATIEAIKMNLPEFSEDSEAQSLEARSDDENSLATSEPPLDGIPIVVAPDNLTESQLTSNSNGTVVKSVDNEEECRERQEDLSNYGDSAIPSKTGGTDISIMTDQDVLVFAKALESQETDNLLSTGPQAGLSPRRSPSEHGSVTTIEVLERVENLEEYHDDPVEDEGQGETGGPSGGHPDEQGLAGDHSKSVVFGAGYGALTSAWEGNTSRTSICSDTEVISRKQQQKQSLADFILQDKVARKGTGRLEPSANKTTSDQMTKSAGRVSGIWENGVAATNNDRQITVQSASGPSKSGVFTKVEMLKAVGKFADSRRSSTSIFGDVEIEEFP